MPEYLSPGVFIEEIPARLKAIEGVSTSTAGLVGAAMRGAVAGVPAPFSPQIGDTQTGVLVPPDTTPVLVTSLAEYSRQFGRLFDAPDTRGYLGHSMRAFFDNGGRRAFIARVAGAAAARAMLQVSQGTQLRLARAARVGDQVIFLTSLRGVASGGAATMAFNRTSDGTLINLVHPIASYDTQADSVRLAAPLVAADVLASGTLEPNEVFAVPSGTAVSAGTGPVFHARNVGAWGANLKVLIANADRPPTPLAAPAIATDLIIQVRSTSSFYRGAIVEIDHGAPASRSYHAVVEILPGNRLQLDTATGAVATTAGFARVVEVDVFVEDSDSGAFESFKGLSWNPDNDPTIRLRHYSTAINTRSLLVYVQPPGFGGLAGAETVDIADQPITDRATLMSPPALTSGSDGAALTDADVVGVDGGPGLRTGIQSLQDIDDIRIIGVPGVTTPTVQAELITQAERMRYRFAVLDAPRLPAPPSAVNGLLTHRNAYDSSFAAYYTPWPQITIGDRQIDLPPSGFVIGIYARTDNDRGVWKAPANEVVRGATALNLYITTGEQDLLNPRGVNVIRRFEGRGTRVWGARTLSSDPEFRYVNVRRFLIFMEASIDRGTQWVVFEPNSPETWSRVVDSVSAFLHTQWRVGALFGRKPEDAFFVRCDETTMTVDDIQNGRLVCEIGVAIVRPAEFVIFRIEQITGYATKS
ncbi:MAG: phage tail sheath subtilisin-like domain-containing protein [Vicinamibacterales bacterium]